MDFELRTKRSNDAAGIARAFRYVYGSVSSDEPALETLYTEFHTYAMARLYQRDCDGKEEVQALNGDQWQRI